MMFLSATNSNQSSLGTTIVLFLVTAVVIHRVLFLKGFFNLTKSKNDSRNCTLIQVIATLGLYFLNAFFLTPILFEFVSVHLAHHPILQEEQSRSILIQSLHYSLNILLLGGYILLQKKEFIQGIWKDNSLKNSFFYDISVGFLTWFVSFPVVLVISSVSELIVSQLFRQEEIDQLAVKFLKTNTTSFGTLIFALSVIIIAAPFIEEFLFRGCLQNFLRKILGTKIAIITTSLLFASLHFSFSQEASNIPLLLSLFVFSLYLGFVYEKTRALSSSIVLHMTFNTISAFRIIFS